MVQRKRVGVGLSVMGLGVGVTGFQSPAVGLATIFCGLLIALWPRRWIPGRILRSRGPDKARDLDYLTDAESDLSTVVRGVAWHSAWGKLYSARLLAQEGKLDEFGEPFVVQTAKFLVCKAMMDGELTVRGRAPGQTEYESIPNTEWRLAALRVERDPGVLWKVIVIPRTDGSATLHRKHGFLALRNCAAFEKSDVPRQSFHEWLVTHSACSIEDGRVIGH